MSHVRIRNASCPARAFVPRGRSVAIQLFGHRVCGRERARVCRFGHSVYLAGVSVRTYDARVCLLAIRLCVVWLLLCVLRAASFLVCVCAGKETVHTHIYIITHTHTHIYIYI